MLDIKEIQKTLPQRYPFLLIDRIIEIAPEIKAVGVKNVTINESFFQGHFPDNPVMPGVLILEAMAQVAAILLIRSGVKGDLFTFKTIDLVKFRQPVLPGDQLRIEIEMNKKEDKAWKFSAKSYVGEKLTTEAEFSAMLVSEKGAYE